MRSGLHHANLLNSMGNDAVAMAQLQLILPLLMQQPGSSNNSQSQAALQMLAALLGPQASTSSSSANNALQQQQQMALLMMLLQTGQLDPEMLGMTTSTKKSSSSSSKAAAEKLAAEKAAAEKAAAEKAEKEAAQQAQQLAALAALVSAASAPQNSQQQGDIQKMIVMMQLETMSKTIGLSTADIMSLGSLHPETKVPLRHKKTDKVVESKVKNIAAFIKDNPDYKLDMNMKPAASTTPAPVLTPAISSAAETSAPASARASAPSSPKGSLPASKADTPVSATPVPTSPSGTPIK